MRGVLSTHSLFPTLLRLAVEWLRLSQVFLALDAATVGYRWSVIALGVVVHQHTIPVAWTVVLVLPAAIPLHGV